MQSPAQADSSFLKRTQPRTKKLTAQNDGVAGKAAPLPQIDAAPASPAAPSDSAQLDELERAADQLSNRAEAVNSSLDHLQQQQNSAGLGLRGATSSPARPAWNKLVPGGGGDSARSLARAKKYLDLAGSNVEALERFLGH